MHVHHMTRKFECLTNFRILKWMIILDIKITFVSDRVTSCLVVDLFSKIFLFLQHLCWWTLVMHTNKLWCSLWSCWGSSLSYIWWETFQFYGEMFLLPHEGRQLQHRSRKCGLCRCYLRGEVLFVDKVIYFFELVYPCCAWQLCRPKILYSLHNDSPSFYSVLYCSTLAVVYGYFRQFVKNFDKHGRHRVSFILRKLIIGISLCFHWVQYNCYILKFIDV